MKVDKKVVDKTSGVCYNFFMDLSFSRVLNDNAVIYAEFKDQLLNFNEKCNVTSIRNDEEVWIKHFYDSVAPEKYFFMGARVVEIGSGGGFPSVPLMIARPDLRFTLIESTGKKCAFLSGIVDKFKLNCENVLNIRAESGAKDGNLREKFDIATARAVAGLSTLCEYCLPFVKKGGRFIAYKGANESVDDAANAIKILGGEIEEIYPYELPLSMGERRAIIIKKVCATHEKYPRGNGKERKNPL